MMHRGRPVAVAVLVTVGSCAGLAVAAQTQAPAQPPAPGAAGSVLPGRPDAAEAGVGDALDPAFVSTTAGIGVRPPTGGKMIRRGGGGDEIVRFVNEEKRWQFVVSRVMLSEPIPLATRDPEAAKNDPKLVGFADSVAGQMPSETPGKLLRSELTPVGGYDGALMASKFREGDRSLLMQQAVIRRTDKIYYVISYTTPLTTAEVETDPAALRAMETFGKIIDSVELLDQEAIAKDQVDRLFRTRSLMVNWTPERLRQSLVREQFLRLIRDGKDIGYTYIVEEPANDLPRAGKTNAPANESAPTGIRIGVRSRTVPDAGFVVDAESWMWVRYGNSQDDSDKAKPGAAAAGDADPQNQYRNRQNQETFRNVVVTTEQNNKPNYAMEVGTSVLRNRIIPVRVNEPGSVTPRIEERREDRIELQIWSSSNLQQLPAISREVPPYYLPQALGHLLPRLVPLNSPKTYMFASYVSEQRQVMTRYVDVLPTTTVSLAGQKYQAVPVQEKMGLEGSITTHYVTPDARYLGSVNADNKITIVASDANTIRTIWKDANLNRPADVDEKDVKPPAAAAPASTPPRATRSR